MGATLFAKNLIRLLKFDLKAHHKAIKKYADYEYMLDNLKYEICDEVKSLRLPKVLGQKESVAKIIRDKCSVVRYGDGEFNLMFGRAIGFQEYTPEIAARLTEVLQSDDPSILVGIPDRFGSLADVDAQSRAYWRTFMAKNRTQIYKYLNFEQTYADACFTDMPLNRIMKMHQKTKLKLKPITMKSAKSGTGGTLQSSAAKEPKFFSMIFMIMPNQSIISTALKRTLSGIMTACLQKQKPSRKTA